MGGTGYVQKFKKVLTGKKQKNLTELTYKNCRGQRQETMDNE